MASIQEALAYCNQLLREHGLWDQGWRAAADLAKRRAGICRYRRRIIGLSAPLTALNTWEQTVDTIRHEIAHALVGPGHAHDEVWQAMATRLGAAPQARCVMKTPPGRYQLHCTRCGKLVREYHRRPRMNFAKAWASCCGREGLGHLQLKAAED